MKKVLFLILAMFVFLTFGVRNVNAATAEYDYGVGYSTNLVRPRQEMYIPSSPILDKDFLDSMTLTQAGINSYTDLKYVSNSIYSITNQISNKYNNQFGLSGAYNIYAGELYNNFSLNVDYAQETYKYQYYEIRDIMRYMYSITLPNSASFMYYYKDHFNPGYIDALDRLSSGLIDYETFFDTYGTHLITSAIYGGKIETYYSVVSNEVMFTNSVQNTISTQISLSAAQIAEVGNTHELSLSGRGEFTSTNHISSTNVIAKGGHFSGLTNDALLQWQNSLIIYGDNNEVVQNNTALITYSDNGLLPLWEILPDEYRDISATMESAYNTYVLDEREKLVNLLYCDNELVYSSRYVQESEIEINDSGRFNQSKTNVDLLEQFGIDMNVLEELGYDKVRLVFNCKIKEKWDGYQWFFIYLDLSDSSLLASYSDSIGDGEKVGVYQNVSFEIQLDIDDLLSNEFVIRYGASGNYEDTWLLKQLSLKIIISKE